MRLNDVLKLKSIAADGSTGEWFEYYYGIQPVPTFHPPSLMKTKAVATDMPTDGWHKNDPPLLKKRAREDMAEILKRVRRQVGKPEITRSAAYPIFPSIAKWI